MEIREFVESDYWGYAGAESWRDGAKPLFGTGAFENGEPFELVLDATGGCLVLEDEQAVAGGYVLRLPFPNQAAARAFANGIRNPKHKLDFFLLGFLPA